VGDAAEKYRRELAVYWLGGELPPWPTPCPVRVVAGSHLAAQGVTTYNRAPVRDFQMEVVGSPERILDSVLPHEVTHTILATYFGRPLPRWADEGICTTVEHPSERQKHEVKLREFLRSRRGIAMNTLFLMTEYPADVLPMYAQGYSVCQFLIAQQGPRGFVSFLGDYMDKPSWTHHVRTHYGYESLAELQEAWLAWVADGSGPVDTYVKTPANRAAPVDAVAASGSGEPRSAAGARPVPARPTPAIRPASATGSAESSSGDSSAIALASANDSAGEGWYSRLRQQAISGGNGPIVQPLARQTSAGPSGLHSVSQPQPEQGMTPGGILPGGGFPAQSLQSPHSAAAGDYRPGSLSASGAYWR
jgi:hypothetical protein